MIVELGSIGNTPKAISETYPAAAIDLEDESVSLTSPVKFSGETVRVAGQAHLRGRIEADITLDCTRCLEPVRESLDISFDAIFVDASEETRVTEKAVAVEELDESLVENGLIDIAEAVREQILLATPDQVFCREDCKGLCLKCGANLNLIDCKCKDDEIDPRWAALKSLK